MQPPGLSIYFVIGSPPNQYFDSSRIGSYFPISTSLLINSISRLFFDLPDKNLQILGIGQKKDYTNLNHTNNKAYYQSEKEDFYTISADQNIKFKLFLDLNDLFQFLGDRIFKDSSKNILIILQDHGSLYHFNKLPHIRLLNLVSKSNKNFLIYDDSCNSGSIIDLFQKNQTLFTYVQEYNLKIQISDIANFYYFALFQSKMFKVFKNNISTFLPECINFISQLSNTLLEESFYNVIVEILNAIDKQNQNQDQEQKEYFLTPIDKDFFNKLINNSNFDIDKCIKLLNVTNRFSDLDSFITYLQNNNIKNIANLLMFDSYYSFTSETDKQFLKYYHIFTIDNYELFFNIEKQVFDVSKKKNTIIKTTKEKMILYEHIANFFYQYFSNNLVFFDCKSNVEFITSTSLDKTSLSYPSIITNSITKVFPNTPTFAYFIRNAFFIYGKHNIHFPYLEKNTYYNPTTKFFYFFPSYIYPKFEKPTGDAQLLLLSPKYHNHSKEDKTDYFFNPSPSLPNKIAAVRFLTHFVRDYLSKFQKEHYFPKLNFSCGLSIIPSNLLINFILLSIFPNTDAFPFDLKLNNENFLKVLKFANLVFQTHSMEASINKGRFEFTTFFSVVISSKIRYLFAKNLLLILKEPSNSLYLFSIKELEYARDFLQSKKLEKCTNASDESTVLFLNELFSDNLIDQYYSVTVPDEDKKKSEKLNDLHELKKSPEFNLQKMFLDLESSILNILPSNFFVFSSIYSYLLLKYHDNLDANPETDVKIIQKIFSELLEEEKFNKIEEKLNTFNSLADILQFCTNNIFECLQKTYNFLQLFYQYYYIVSFCKVSNKYKKSATYFNMFLKKVNEIPPDSIQIFFDSMTRKLKPFPLFCLPFIFFDSHSYSSYKLSLATFIKNFKSVEPTKNSEEFKKLPNSSSLFESNYFYSEQFRIQLSNLSLYSDLKIYIINNIDILSKFSNSKNNVSDFLSHPFFTNPFPPLNSFIFECEEISDCKNVLEFSIGTILETFIKQSISSFIDEFVLTTTTFLHSNIEKIIELKYTSSTDINDIQLFFSPNDENNVYINSIINNLNDLINNLSISKPDLAYKIVVNDDMHNNLVRLVYSVLEARFNDKVEIDPIVEQIPKYVEKFSDQSDWCDPTDGEFMALCSAIRFTVSPTDRFKERFYPKHSDNLSKEEENIKDNDYSPPNSPSNTSVKVGNYRNEFGDDDDDNKDAQLIQNPKYTKIIEEALDLSEIEVYHLRERYDVRTKKWTEIIWSIFYEFFNKKLEEIGLNFDKNNNYSQGNACIHCLINENSVIMDYLPQLENVKDLHEKEVWIGRFIYLHKEYEYQIKSAYVYALMSSYAFLDNYYTFGDF
ncbi:hypothetical protein M9Y10_019563 [Tritrichomonas musculus]|uniref:Caspase family p20 domain-containing protein n=1 Tax=Tritrichomonas musculus TaxID=1915356 RepID=A0ABR2HGN7_9EUKA